MKKQQYLFISRKSSHYRYYKKLVSYLGNTASLKGIKLFAFPNFSTWKKVNELDINDLVDVHIKRKQARHPILKNNPVLARFTHFIYEYRERCRASYYFSFFASHPADTVIFWNGMKQPNRTPYIVAKASGKRTFLFENGLLPNTTVLDPKGVNAVNSLPRHSSFYMSWQGDTALTNKKLVVRAPHKKRKTNSKKITLPERYVFVPFQVPNDTQIVCHSPWIPDMESFYHVLERALISLKQQKDWRPFKLVIKEHPSWPKNFTELYDQDPDIIFANNNDTQELIENSLAVVTINSTVGIEALLLDKPVITLGNSFLNIDKLVVHCDNQLSFNKALAQIELFEINNELIERFLAYLETEYLLPQSWNDLSEPDLHFASVQQRLEHSYLP